MPVLIQRILSSLAEALYMTLIYDNRYRLIVRGLQNTLTITVFATLLGVAIGTVIALIKYFARNRRALRPLDMLCDLYITVIRGTPVVVQLLILSTVVFASSRNGLPVAVIGFGLNSGAYVAEIIRAGIYAVDKGQSEAGRSLGLGQVDTMRFIVMPQAVKNILPALGNEFIVLLKETSVAGYVAVHDLTKAGEIVKSMSYRSTPLFVVAIIYLTLVMGMTAVLRRLERRLAKSDNR